MEDWYISRYSYFFRSTTGEFLAYSSKTNSFIELSKQIFEYLKQCQNKDNRIKECEISEDILKTLIDEGFVGSKSSDNDFLLESQMVTQAAQHDTNHLNLVLVPTLNCNFNCPYCFENSKRGGIMDENTIGDLLNFINENSGKKDLRLTWYGGEPLLGLNVIKKILNGIKDQNVFLKQHSIITNGYYFDEKAIEVFEQFPLDSIQITLDGQRDRHNKLRALKGTLAPSYDRIINNIMLVAEKMPNTELHIRVNIDKNNVDDYFDINREIKEMVKSDNVIVYPGIIRLENEEKTNIVEPAFGRWEVANFLYDIFSKGILEGEIYPTRHNTKTCCASCVNSYIIGPSGEIYKCWNDVSDESKVVGHINQEGIENKELYYRYHVGCAWYNNSECKECFFLPICNGKCAWYNERNLYHNGEFNLCQCMQKAPGLLDKCLEHYYKSLK